jgi:hypothetical protein
VQYAQLTYIRYIDVELSLKARLQSYEAQAEATPFGSVALIEVYLSYPEPYQLLRYLPLRLSYDAGLAFVFGGYFQLEARRSQPVGLPVRGRRPQTP